MAPLTKLQTKCEKINALDLSSIVESLTRENSGNAWNTREAIHYCELYRSFLYLVWKYPDEKITPSPEIDKVWHQHILHTKKYEFDCLNIFGKFLHHNPFGEKEDEKILLLSYEKRTIELVEIEFPELFT